MTEKIIEQAYAIAQEAHAGQRDKGNHPYMDHITAVWEKIKVKNGTAEEQIVALLHDVIEDSHWTKDKISTALDDFPGKGAVLNALDAITKIPDESYEDYIKRVQNNPIARKVKMIDLEHNSDLSRIPHPSKNDYDRIKKYVHAYINLSEVYMHAASYEKAITPKILQIASTVNAKLEGFDHRLKSIDSYERKVYTDMLHGNKTLEEAIGGVRDLVRYTYVFESEDYTKQVKHALYELTKHGMQVERVKDFWNNDTSAYKGINVVLKTSDHFPIEVQFHTPESLKAKNEMHILYENYRLLETTEEEKKALEHKMFELSQNIQEPHNIHEIQNLTYDKKFALLEQKLYQFENNYKNDSKKLNQLKKRLSSIMSKKGSTTMEYIIIFFIIALLLTVLYQTWFFIRVHSVVVNAAEEAARVYATNYENPNREKIARNDALSLVAANLRTGMITGTYTVNDVPPGWIQGTLGKKDDRYVLQTVPYEAATESLRAELDRLVGKHVAAKIDTVTDESAKWNTVTAVPNDLKPAPKTGINIIPGQLEFAWYSPVPAAPNNRQEMDRLLEQHRDRIKGQGLWKNRSLDFYSSYDGSSGLIELRKIPGFEQLPQTNFLMDFWGYLYIPETGTYVFGVDSDDASDVLIDGDVVAAFYGGHGMKVQPVPGPEVRLERGYHPFRVRLHQGPGVFGLQVYWKKPGDQNFTLIEPKYFASAVPETTVKTITIDDRVPVQIAGHLWNTFFLDQSGRLWTVGFNDRLNTRGDHRLFTTNVEPERLFPDDTFKMISAKSSISGVAVKKDGTVITWGYVYDDKPYRVMKFNESHDEIVHVDLGQHNILYLDRNGKLFVTAYNHYGDGALGYSSNYWMAVKVMENVVDAAAASEASYAVTSDGKAYAWGYSFDGRLGIGKVDDDQRTPQEISYFTQNNIKIKRVKAGANFSMFLSSDGRVFSTGGNESGQLGLGDRSNRWIPEQIPNLSGIVDISASGANVLALDQTGHAYAWGSAFGSTLPVKLSFPKKVKRIWATPAGGFVLLESDELYAFGSTTFAQLGTMSQKPLSKREIVRVYPFSKAGTYTFLVPLNEPDVFLNASESKILDPIMDDQFNLTAQFSKNKYLHNMIDVDFWKENVGESVKHLEIPISVGEPTYKSAPLPAPRTTYMGREATIIDARNSRFNVGVDLAYIDGNGGLKFKLALTQTYPQVGWLSLRDLDGKGLTFSIYFTEIYRAIYSAWFAAESMRMYIDSSDEFYDWMDVEITWNRIESEPDFARYTLTVKTNRKTYTTTFKGVYFNRTGLNFGSLKGTSIYISDLYVKSEAQLQQKIERTLDVSDLKPGEYTVVLSTRSTIKDETSPVRLAFLPSQSVKKIRYARFSVHDPSISGGYVDPGELLKMRLSLRNESAFTIQPGELIVEWREGKTVVRKDPLPMGKSFSPGEWLNIAVDLPVPEKKGIYDLVIRYDDAQDPNTRSTEVVFSPVNVGILPSKLVITAVQEAQKNMQTISSPLVEIRFKETPDQVESEVIYHLPLLWDFGRFFGMGGEGPIWDVVGRSVMRLEKPLFGPKTD